MSTTPEHDARIAGITFAAVYPHYVAKVEKKGRTVAELHQVITWLTGFDEPDLQRLMDSQVTLEQFFAEAKIHPNAVLITGSICGYRIEKIGTPLTKQVRYMDKLVDELAKGRPMEKILRSSPAPHNAHGILLVGWLVLLTGGSMDDAMPDLERLH